MRLRTDVVNGFEVFIKVFGLADRKSAAPVKFLSRAWALAGFV